MISKIKAIVKHPLVIVFAVITLFLSIADIMTEDIIFSDWENRPLTQRPDFEIDDFMDGDFSIDYETYINEQFYGRDTWITVKSVAESVLGKTENNSIVFGEDGYMFDKYITYDEEQFAKNIGFANEFLNSQTIPVYFGIIPNSYEILSDKVPVGLPNIDQAKIIDRAYENVISTQNLDITSALSQHSDEYIYYKTDHHWTTIGAYYAYQDFCEASGETAVDISEINSVEVEDFLGTYYSKSKQINVEADIINYYDIKINSLSIDDVSYDSLYDMKMFEDKNKYSAFLHDNNGLTKINSIASQENEGKRILVIKDSYANSFIPFLTYNYENIDVVDLRYYSLDVKELVLSNEYDSILLMYNFMNFANDTNIFKLIM